MIETEQEFEAWLKDKPPQIHHIIGARAALRAFPAALAYSASAEAASHENQLALLTARAIVTSAVVGNGPTADVDWKALLSAVYSAAGSAAFSAALSTGDSAAYFAADSAAHSAAGSTALSTGDSVALFADSAALSAAYSAAYLDCDLTLEAEAARPFQARLWHDAPMPSGLAEEWQGIVNTHHSAEPDWAFWCDWYQGFLDGKPLDWDLQEAIALIPDADWEKGPGHIADRIAAIQAEMAAERFAGAEEMVWDDASATFSARPLDKPDDQLIAEVSKSVDLALKIALSGNCGLNDSATVTLYIRAAVDDCQADPCNFEFNLQQAGNALADGVAAKLLFEDERLHALGRAISNGVDNLRAYHSTVRERAAKRASHSLRAMKALEKLRGAEHSAVMADLLRTKEMQEFEIDSRAIQSGGPLEREEAAKRQIGRIAQMKIKAGDLFDKVNESTGYRLLSFLLVAKELLSMVFG